MNREDAEEKATEWTDRAQCPVGDGPASLITLCMGYSLRDMRTFI